MERAITSVNRGRGGGEERWEEVGEDVREAEDFFGYESR